MDERYHGDGNGSGYGYCVGPSSPNGFGDGWASLTHGSGGGIGRGYASGDGFNDRGGGSTDNVLWYYYQ